MGVVFPPVTWKLVELEASKEHRLTLENWSEEEEEVGRRLDRYLQSYEAAKSSVFELFGWSSVFQAVIIACIAQAQSLTCRNSLPIFGLSSLTSVGTFWACLLKLARISHYNRKYHFYKDRHTRLHDCISRLREAGSDFDIAQALSTDLLKVDSKPTKTTQGTFVKRWILSYGAILLLLVSFSASVLVLLAQVLC